MFKEKRIDLLSYLAVLLGIILLVGICSSGCMSIMSAEEWDRFGEGLEKRLEAAGIQEEEAELKADELVKGLKDLEAAAQERSEELATQIKDLGVDVLGEILGLPEQVKESTKDWTDDLLKYLLGGGGGLAALAATYASARNSEKGKLLGPIFKKKDGEPVKLTAKQIQAIKDLNRLIKAEV